MKKIAVCFTRKGQSIIEKLNEESRKRGIEPAEGFFLGTSEDMARGFTVVNCSIGEWTGQHFVPGNALIFVGALGIAVRAIAPFLEDKLRDPRKTFGILHRPSGKFDNKIKIPSWN